MLLCVVGQSLKPVKFFFFFLHRRSVAQQCWIRLHSSSNIVGATHAHYAWFTKTYGLYPSHDTLQVWELLHPFAHHYQHARNNSRNNGATMLGVVASVCTQPITRLAPSKSVMIKQEASNVGNCVIHILTQN